MPTMILVEDESFERTALINNIDWSLIGVQIIGEAANGEQGLSLVLSQKPDIVLTDVSMPVMNGIEMSRKIRAMAPETKILFLSAYDDFDYAKQAVDLNIQAYVMKPLNEIELLRAVKKAADSVTEKALESRILSNMKNNYSSSVALARQAFISRAISGLNLSLEDARVLGMEWICSHSGYFGVFISFCNTEQLENIDADLEILNQRCEKICRQLVNVFFDSQRLLTIFNVQTSESTIKKDAETIIREYFEQKGMGKIRIESIFAEEEGETPAELYAELMNRSLINGAEPLYSKNRKNKQQIAQDIEDIIVNEYHLPLTIEEIAKTLHFTPNYIGTVFKTVKKISVNKYLMQVRLEKAELLLKNSEMSVNDISEQCGFSNITYFYTAFKKEFGLTPVEFRRKITAEN